MKSWTPLITILFADSLSPQPFLEPLNDVSNSSTTLGAIKAVE